MKVNLLEPPPSPELSILGSSLKWVKKSNNRICLYKSFGGIAELEHSGCYSEYFASQLCRALGLSHAEYDLVKVDNKLCSCCEIFTNEYKHMIHVAELSDDALHLEEHIRHYTGAAQKQFRDLMLVDCLLLNVDRHDENIALVYDDNLRVIGVSPFYDFDHSLFYDLGLLDSDGTEINRKVKSYQPKTYVCHFFEEQFKYCIYEEMYKKISIFM